MTLSSEPGTRLLDAATRDALVSAVEAAKARGWRQDELRTWFSDRGVDLSHYLAAKRGDAVPDEAASTLAMVSVTGLPERPPGVEAADEFPDIPAAMKAARRWLLWKALPGATPADKPRKTPFYVTGRLRGKDIALDSPEDVAELATYEDACAVLAAGGYAGLGFALGPDGEGAWQGIDLDNLEDHPGLQFVAEDLPGYVERSPSGRGLHAIGYGHEFRTLGANATGIEAYARGRYFTVTGESAGTGDLTCLAEFVERRLAPLHDPRPQDTSAKPEAVGSLLGAFAVRDLRSALAHMRSDDRELWIRMGHALKELGEQGRGLWIEWSQTSDKYDAADAARVWDSFKPLNTGYQAVFAEAQRQGWINPASGGEVTPHPVSSEPGAPPQVLDPWERYIVPAFPMDVLPAFLRRYVEQQALSIGACRSGIAMAALTAASGAISHDFRLKMLRTGDWHARPRLWTVLVGDPSDKKSPIVNAVTAPLHERDISASTAYARAYAAWEELMEAKQAGRRDQPQKPARHVVQDVTAEKLSEILSRSDRGALVQRDELAGWIGSMEQYKAGKGAGSADRAHWIKAYDGGRYTVDRVKGETVLSNFSVSFLGAVQPDRLAELGNLTSDGLLQRFMPVMLGKPTLPEEIETEATAEEYARVLSYLAELQPARILSSADAHEVVREFQAQIHEYEQSGIFSKGMTGFLGKLPGVLGSLALVLHLLSDPESGRETAVSGATMRAARTVLDAFVIPHAMEFYRAVDDKTDGEIVRSVASYLLTSDGSRYRASDFAANVRLLRGLTLWELQRRLSLLVVGGWLRPEDNTPTCRAWLLEDGVREAFAARAEAEGRRKAELRDKIKEAGKAAK